MENNLEKNKPIGFWKFSGLFLLACIFFLVLYAVAKFFTYGLKKEMQQTTNAADFSKFEVVEELTHVGLITHDKAGIIVDKETGVEYVIYHDHWNSTTSITPRINANGKPYIRKSAAEER